MSGDKKARSPGDPPESMTQIYLGLLKKGPTWSPEETVEVTRDQREHLALLQRLGEAGEVLIAGPIPEGEILRGVVVCQADSVEEARAFFAEDAHLNSGRLVLEMFPWMVPSQLLHVPLLRVIPPR